MIKCLQETAILDSQDEDADGLEAFRGLRSALIIEIMAGGLLWAGWFFAPRIAAWWGAR